MSYISLHHLTSRCVPGVAPLANALITRAVKNVPLAVHLYWFLAAGADDEDEACAQAYAGWRDQLLERAEQSIGAGRMGAGRIAADLLATQSLVDAFRCADKTLEALADAVGGCDMARGLCEGLTAPLLTRPEQRVIELHVGKLQIIDSATRPTVLPCSCASGEMHELIHKRDALQKDALVMGAISIMKGILQQDGIEAPLTLYRILPTSYTDGFIEVVQGSKTLYSLQQEGSLKDALHQCAASTGSSLDKVQQRFMRSCAAYCVVTYLLGIGDRHLDNLMLSTSGALFHIDFSFVLGQDPKPLMPPMRLSKEMVDAMGGEMSQTHCDFHMVCEQMFLCLRRRPSLFATLLLALVPDQETGSSVDCMSAWEFTADDLHREVIHRFMPGLSDPEAATEFRQRVEASAAFCLAEEMNDMLRHYRRQGVMGQVVEAGWNLLAPVVSALGASVGAEAEE